jgi:hypothetical protein
MYIDEMSKKKKIELLKEELNSASAEILDMMLLEFGYEYSDETE